MPESACPIRCRCHPRQAFGPRSFAAGIAMVEALIGIPVVLLLALVVVQIALLMHARDALHVALLEAARAGSVAHAGNAAIQAGLARGLAPLFPTGAGTPDPQGAWARAAAELQSGLQNGWIRLQKLSPTRESFADWGRPARDEQGEPLDGTEIPIDHLATESSRTAPASGQIGLIGDLPVGRASGQTLVDATLLKLQLDYGVPLEVPLAGPMIAWALSAADGCVPASSRRLGAIDLGRPALDRQARGWACAFYRAGGAGPGARPRIPVRTTALVRMQTPPRLDGDTPTSARDTPTRAP